VLGVGLLLAVYVAVFVAQHAAH
ncbi:MAG: hypothetical protein JWO08_1249, partial [Verrucomicrobiaceae bacterium]|nr:hypothetical protein [Verrucomicrobiaceae bacterium]